MARSRTASCRTRAKGPPNEWWKRYSTALVALDSMKLGRVRIANRGSEIAVTDYLRFDSASAPGGARRSPEMEEPFAFAGVAVATERGGLIDHRIQLDYPPGSQVARADEKLFLKACRSSVIRRNFIFAWSRAE